MRLVQAPAPGSPPPRASFGAHFIPSVRRSELASELRARGYVVASVPRATPAGRLRQAVEEAVESALALRGALPPGVSVDADAATSLRDQIARVHGLGAAGIALFLPPLGDVVAEAGMLGPSDSTVLTAWSEAAQTGPVSIVLDDGDRGLRMLAPVRLEEILAESAPTRRALAPEARLFARPSPLPEPESATVARVVPSEPPPSLTEDASPHAPAEVVRGAPAGRLKPRSALQKLTPPQPMPAVEPVAARMPATKSAPPPPMPVEPPRPLRAQPEEIPEIERTPPVADTLPPPPPLPADFAPPTPPPVLSAVERVLTASEWRAFAMDLDNARGPKPAGVIDRLFATRYMPLLGAVSRGHADATVRNIVDGFRTSFEHSYTEGYSAIRATGKRPVMVLDAPEVAAKIGRLNNARAVRLLLVDALRYDLGERTMARLKPRVSGRAVCVDRPLLWSALPTMTPVQTALLGRGPEGMRDPLPEPGPEHDIVRGRAITTIRRERYGTKEVFKLDLVEARLRAVGPAFDERMSGIADETAQVIAKFIEGLPPRTLLFIFGDHGFRLPCDARGTGPATQGGASPEEVLVPGYAWLVGGVH
ncbi:hypothetical protein [Polyangium aurulentum]|uniref:hypothetical protein n=1 Tax=Polyangium aurulentum TaxID=2567896 RepID=UPI0010ADD477|nr:hypothetical protein [Polyangium aurulentum]UQA61602.1 hypothetical protein E8A73_014470 [Polyangium aurulentum]